MNKIVRKIEVSKQIDAAIDRLAKDTSQTPSQIVSEAIEQLQAEYEDLSIELERWAEYERTGDAIDLESSRKQMKALLKPPASRRRTGTK